MLAPIDYPDFTPFDMDAHLSTPAAQQAVAACAPFLQSRGAAEIKVVVPRLSPDQARAVEMHLYQQQPNRYIYRCEYLRPILFFRRKPVIRIRPDAELGPEGPLVRP